MRLWTIGRCYRHCGSSWRRRVCVFKGHSSCSRGKSRGWRGRSPGKPGGEFSQGRKIIDRLTDALPPPRARVVACVLPDRHAKEGDPRRGFQEIVGGREPATREIKEGFERWRKKKGGGINFIEVETPKLLPAEENGARECCSRKKKKRNCFVGCQAADVCGWP